MNRRSGYFELAQVRDCKLLVHWSLPAGGVFVANFVRASPERWLVVHRVFNEPVTPAPSKPLEATPPGDTHGGASYLQASYPRITFNR